VRLAAQRAKAWARMGDRRQVEVALDRGRYLLESFTPHNLDHHFMVDPSKFDLYAMDCYRILGRGCAREDIRRRGQPDLNRLRR
jgi:hypothetical protein